MVKKFFGKRGIVKLLACLCIVLMLESYIFSCSYIAKAISEEVENLVSNETEESADAETDENVSENTSTASEETDEEENRN